MTTDVARQIPQHIVDPDTGEEILRSDTAKVADVQRRIAAYLKDWKEAKAWCDAALIEAADERNEWVFDVDGLKVKVDPPSKATIDWDEEELQKLEAHLSPTRYGELVTQVVSLKPQTVKLQALARQAGPDSAVGKIIERAERRKPTGRYVKVES